MYKYVFVNMYLLKKTKQIHIYKGKFSAFNNHTQLSAVLEDKTR